MGTIKVILTGVIAGLAGTVVLSLLMLTKGWVPQLDTVVMLDGIARTVFSDMQAPVPMAGWLWHFVIGTLWWGPLFGLMAPILPGRETWQKGISFGFGASLLTMLMTMPLAGAGYFGMELSPLQAFVTVLLHLAYGLVLGVVFQRLAANPVPA